MLPVMRIQLKSRLWRHLRRFIPHSGALGVNIHPPHTSPGLTLHPPPTLTHCHRYTTTHPSSQESSVCWKCHRELNDGGDGSHGVRFFCPCDKNVVLPPSTNHTYFEIMDWYVIHTHTHTIILTLKNARQHSTTHLRKSKN